MALAKLVRARALPRWPLRETVAATSVGICAGQAVLDLAYVEDSEADVDCNIVGTASGAFVEVQGTAERRPFTEPQLLELLALAGAGLAHLRKIQADASPFRYRPRWVARPLTQPSPGGDKPRKAGGPRKRSAFLGQSVLPPWRARINGRASRARGGSS
jgi:hypothetical protein